MTFTSFSRRLIANMHSGWLIVGLRTSSFETSRLTYTRWPNKLAKIWLAPCLATCFWPSYLFFWNRVQNRVKIPVFSGCGTCFGFSKTLKISLPWWSPMGGKEKWPLFAPISSIGSLASIYSAPGHLVRAHCGCRGHTLLIIYLFLFKFTLKYGVRPGSKALMISEFQFWKKCRNTEWRYSDEISTTVLKWWDMTSFRRWTIILISSWPPGLRCNWIMLNSGKGFSSTVVDFRKINITLPRPGYHFCMLHFW